MAVNANGFNTTLSHRSRSCTWSADGVPAASPAPEGSTCHWAGAVATTDSRSGAPVSSAWVTEHVRFGRYRFKIPMQLGFNKNRSATFAFNFTKEYIINNEMSELTIREGLYSEPVSYPTAPLIPLYFLTRR